ncbi:hypothetical protein D3C85_1641070 [compost metagenome]
MPDPSPVIGNRYPPALRVSMAGNGNLARPGMLADVNHRLTDTGEQLSLFGRTEVYLPQVPVHGNVN